ncbi:MULTISPECIES: hypothetical protein [Saccharothrix]|uniref:hypothetical protein n=1 Tax=Saccharothrix TaxID=2071 RepID=UPI0009389B5F|nr:hypothetical protein [Saccharothrix sp. CB00851]OKI39059.1 hypothetical protein A6A25_02400 [Saccharothrix sp. CB00851]
MTTPQDPDNRPPEQPYPSAPPPPQQPYAPAPPPLSASELGGYGGQDRPALPEPKEVRLSFFLWLASAILLVVSSALVLTQREAALEEARKTAASTPEVTPEQLEAAVNLVLVGSVIIGVVLAALMVLFAMKARAGRNWARVTLTVIGVLVFLYHLVGFSLVGLVIVLVVAAAVVTLYLPASKAYFDSAKRAG